MAADENGGDFGGDGSVRWRIKSGDEIRTSSDKRANFKVARRRGRSGTECQGIDCQHGDNFRVTVKLPKNKTAEQFIKEIRKGRKTITFSLPIVYVPKQIQVHWGSPRRGAGARSR